LLFGDEYLTVTTSNIGYYNTSGKYSWNTSGVVSYSAPERRDVQTTSTHEFGHWFFLDHSNVSGSTMNLSNRSISEDDKQGVTQLYGSYTGFDNGRASGISNYTTYSARVTGYDGSGAPTLFVVNSGNDAVPSYFGTSMLRIAGSATSGLSYVYFKLFSIDRDTGTSKRGVTISSGARLKWCQYNAQQTTMSIDANFTDGTSLREYQVVDQNGVRVHPAYRSNGPINIWTCYDADLTPVVGKQVRHWYVAYDNSLTQIGGLFRGYIDSLKLIWPGGKP
jgi:hypothetical protein